MPRKKVEPPPEPVKTWPTLEDLPPECTLPQVAAFFHHHRTWAHKLLDREAGVLRVGGRELPLHKRGAVWLAWRAHLADFAEEKVA